MAKKNNDLVPIEEGDNAKYLTTAMAVMELGKNRVDLTDYDATAERIAEYFNMMIERDAKPTMTGLSQAFGINTKTMYEIRHNLPSGLGKMDLHGYKESFVPERVRELIEQAYNVMQNLWESYMMNGKINPASGIFLGKNFYGMKDEVDHVVSVKENPLDSYNAEDIASRYLNDESSFKGD